MAQGTSAKADQAIPEVTILLALCNGARWLQPQLDSFTAQRGVRWSLIAADDGSTDGTRTLVSRFARARPDCDIRLIDGPRRGPATNFLQLLRATGPETRFAAFSDQDDVWLPEKLARATRHLSVLPPALPALYCGRTTVCDESLAQRGRSPEFPRPPSFRNALVQSIAGGNTMVMNRAALDLARAASREAGPVVMHDWWLYQLITGAGGEVLYDAEPMVLYRQHGGNQVGANGGLAAKARRARQVAGGTLRRWNATNVAALAASAHRLTPENRAILGAFARATAAPMRERLGTLAHLGLYRQTLGGRASYWCAAAAGLI